jgi:ABC-type phosphate transport system substrate-binding protein
MGWAIVFAMLAPLELGRGSGRLIWIGVLVLSACTPRTGEQSVTVKGSDTMVQLGQRWAEMYMDLNPGVDIQVTGGPGESNR